MSKKKLELKGQNADRIPSKKKQKMKKTLNTMQKNREKDSINLRDKAEAKKKWAEEQKKLRLERINKLEEELKQLQYQIIKLDGMILAIDQIL